MFVGHLKCIGRVGDDGLPHEKADLAVLSRLRTTLNPKSTQEQRTNQHRQDEDTTWFGVSRDDAGNPTLMDFGRFSTILADSQTFEGGHRYPQLVSFIGQTGAGKSTLVRMLIEQQENERARRPQEQKQFPYPVVGHVADEHTPTSGDVHLYADPGTYFGHSPMLYADCEGLQGGEKNPVGAMFKENEKKEKTESKSWLDHRSNHDLSNEAGRRASKATEEPHKRNRLRRSKRNDSRRLEWAVNDETRKRGYAVAELYPRLLYTFSDCVVFVIRNVRAFEATLLEKIVDWAHASLEKSVNQPALPHAVIVLNATDIRVPPDEWDPAFATDRLMGSVAASIDQVPKFHHLASFWRQRGHDVNTIQDLLLRYYASVQVVRVPAQGRYMLLNEQISKLHGTIITCCNKSYETKRRARMLSTTDELNNYLQAAFDHFSTHLDQPFNFVEAALRANPIPFDFGGNILNLVRSLHNFYPQKDGPWLFKSISSLVASCIMLDTVRRRLRGHQNDKGRIIGNGPFESTFTYEGFINEWLQIIKTDVMEVQHSIDDKFAADEGMSEERIVTNDHLTRVTRFYRTCGGASRYLSNTICLCCFREVPKHPLQCGHVLCESCINAYAVEQRPTFVKIENCPLHPPETRWQAPWIIARKPPLAGVRVLCLDGGGMRGIVDLEVLRMLQHTLGDRIPIQEFFDLIVGTSTGGIIALGLGAERWSISECIESFLFLCGKAFTEHKTKSLAHGGRYRTTALTEALQEKFDAAKYLFGGKSKTNSYTNKVAVTATTETWDEAVVFANYNREHGSDQTYRFERPEHPEGELRLWEVARATSAAPTYFKPFVNVRTRQGYLDGAIYHNNPVEVANDERKLIWREDANFHPDLLFSIGTGHHGEAKGPFDNTGKAPHRRRTRAYRDSETLPKPEDRTKGPRSWSKIPKLGSVLSGMRNRLDNVMSAEETWHRFLKATVPDPYSSDRQRYQRINPDLGFPVPRLDAKDRIADVQKAVQARMQQDINSLKSKVRSTAHRLIASSFYLHIKNSLTSEVSHHLEAVVCCRFADDSEELRRLGELLMSGQTQRFQPHFLYESEQDARPVKTPISGEIIQTMITRSTFQGPRMIFNITKPSTPSIILVQLTEQGEQHPISGFPRALVEEETLKTTRSSDNWDAREANPRLARAEKRRTRLFRSNDSTEGVTSPRTGPTARPGPHPVSEDGRSVHSAPEPATNTSPSPPPRLSSPQSASISELVTPNIPSAPAYTPERRGPPVDYGETAQMQLAMALSRRDGWQGRSQEEQDEAYNRAVEESLRHKQMTDTIAESIEAEELREMMERSKIDQ
ncbi:MAG: hypothetical protein Q9162_007370 [Coniocarpon cinnabarinum]